MQKPLLLVLSLALPSTALAGGLTAPQEAAVVVAPAVNAYDWTGGYGGVQYDHFADGDYTAGPTVSSVEGQAFGIFGGYRHDFGSFVLGGEVDLMFGEGTINAPAAFVGPFDIDVDRLVRVGAEGGFKAGRAFIYGTAGFAQIEITDDTSATTSSDGYFYGIGADFLVRDNVTVGGEVLQHEFDSFDRTAAGQELDLLTVGVNVSLRF